MVLDGSAGQRNRDVVIVDDDEWPGHDTNHRWQRGEPVPHIELRRWADMLVVAPLDANTLAKLALGTCDNCLTCVYRAWDRTRPIVLAPAMNTLMWDHPATARHLRQAASDLGAEPPQEQADVVEWINANARNAENRAAGQQTPGVRRRRPRCYGQRGGYCLCYFNCRRLTVCNVPSRPATAETFRRGQKFVMSPKDRLPSRSPLAWAEPLPAS